MQPTTGIPAVELQDRRARLLQHVQSNGLTGYVLFDEHYIQYFTSFGFLATERPVAFLANGTGELAVFVPEFEVDRVRAETEFERVESYPEYPGTRASDALILARVLPDMGITGPLGADQDGYPGILGYQGPALSEVTGAAVSPLAPFIESMMVRKSEAEVGTDPGEREMVRARAPAPAASTRGPERPRPRRASGPATKRRSRCSRRSARRTAASRRPPTACRRDTAARSGCRSAWAHAVAHNIEFQEGDVLVTETSAPIWGYNAELERAMIIGTPTDEMRRLFDHTVAAQQVAFDALRPGVTCADVDARGAAATSRPTTCSRYWKQHTGHAIGLRNHEAPFLDVGDHTPIEPGMVFTIEPGLYSSEVGGFRHSDTVVVTPDGIDVLTDYPNDIESLTIPV